MAKRTASSQSSSSKKRSTGIDPAWSKDFPWLVETQDGEGMLCLLCHKHNRRPKKCVVGKAIWTDIPCTSLTRQALVRHNKSESHVDATRIEATLRSSRKDGGIEMAFQRVVSAERKAMIGAIKCMYFLTKREIPHTTTVSSDLSADICSLQNVLDKRDVG
jgi:hypothetical protein